MKLSTLLTLLLVLGSSCAAIANENLLKNPGFEAADTAPWVLNSWWIGDQGQTNDAAWSRDPVQPHSGAASQRVAFTTKRGGNLQLTYSLANTFKGGESFQVRFAIRGPSNSTPINLLIDQNAHPWTEYFRASIPLSEDWREHVFNLTLPTKIDRQNLRLMFLLEEENYYWLDDVSLTRLPAKEEGDPLPGNRVAHGSFETGRDRWYARFQESGRTPAVPRAVELNIAAEMKAVPVSDAPAGRNVLRLGFKPGSGVHLTSALFSLRYGWPVEISFWARQLGGQGKLHPSLVS